MGLGSGAAFGLGTLWIVARLDHSFSPLNQAQFLTLLLVLLGTTTLVVWRMLKHFAGHQQAETSLQIAESRFKDTFEQFPFSVQILGADGRTRALNRAWEKLFGGTIDDVKDINLLDDPAIRESGITAYLQVALAGEVAISPAKHYNIREGWPFSSHEAHVNRWIKGTICPVKDNLGRVTELILIHEDITEQTLAQEAHNESETRKAAIMETALDCIISMDGEGNVIEWNPSAESTFGYSREMAMGRLLADLIIPVELRERHAQGLQRYMETGRGAMVGRKLEVSAVRASGEEFPVELTITPIILGEKRIFSGFLRDLTQAKAAEAALLAAHSELEARVAQRTVDLSAALEELQTNYERLERLEALRDALTGMVVHDLRTPLNSMLFGLQTITFLGTVNPAQQECLNVFALGCRDSLGVINDLLDIGKMESGAFALYLEDSCATDLVQQALERVAMLASVKNLHLTAQVEEDLPCFPADQEKLHRLLGNLLGNAIKFAPPDGTVTLGACMAPDEMAVHFWVRDNGAGIPAEAFERIFEKFGQAEPPLGNRETSSGLGLAFCKMIVEAHNGQIWVESQPGQGSLFTATFPFAPAELELEAV